MSQPDNSSAAPPEWRKWSRDYIHSLTDDLVVKPRAEGVRYPCPCCGSKTLQQRGGYELCPVCFWEDDGQDESTAEKVRGGPNGSLSLTEARKNYKKIGSCDEEFLSQVRKPTPSEL